MESEIKKVENIEDFRILLVKKVLQRENDEIFKVILEKLERGEYEKFELYFIDEKRNKEFKRFEIFADSWDLIILDNSDIEKVLEEDKEINEIILDLFNDVKPKYQVFYKQSTNEIFMFEIIKQFDEITVNVLIFKMPFKIYISSY
jgi:hypothetical protein